MVKFELVKNGTKYTFSEELTEEQLQVEDLTQLQSYVSQEPYVFVEVEIVDTATRLINDKQFGQNIIDQFLLILKNLSLSVSTSLTLMQKFSAIQTLLSLGAIKEANILLRTVEVDEIFTLEVRTSLIAQMTDYLNSYNTEN